MKINLNKIFVFMLLALFLVLSVLPFVSCGSTKKLKLEETLKTEIKNESDSTGTMTVKVEEKKQEETIKESSEEKKNYDVKVSDGNEVSIKEYDQDGKLKSETVIKGDGEVKTSSETKASSETIKTDQTKKSDINSSAKIKKSGKENTAGKKASLDLDRKGFSFGEYIYWFILFLVVILLGYLKYKQGFSLFKKQNSNE